jgi:outer membrane immunogenic protein
MTQSGRNGCVARLFGGRGESATVKSIQITYRARKLGWTADGLKACKWVVIPTDTIMKNGEFVMKKLTFAAAAFAVLTGSAIAADLPRKAPVVAPAPVPVATWSGCYLSGGIGYGMWNQDNQTFEPGGAVDLKHTDGGRGWLGRVGGGCDYQFAQRWVVGVLADYDFSSLKGDMTLPGSGLQGEEKSNWAWAAGGRVGYIPWENLMVFVSAGYTQANFEQITLTTGAGGFVGFIPETKYSGWFLGSGYEYRFEWLPGLYWKTEYRFSDLGSKTNQLFNTAGVPDGRSVDTSHKFIQTVTSSLVWRFNWWR